MNTDNVLRTVGGVRDYILGLYGVSPTVVMKGPSDSFLLFYPNWGKHHSIIIQVWEGLGWDAFGNEGSNKVAATLDWIEDLRAA